MRLLLFSDLHLDTAFGWAGPPLGDGLRAHLRGTLDRIAALAAQTRADALLCGGDLVEQARATPDTLAHLRATFAALELPVHIAPGEHDWYGPASPYRHVDWTPNVHVFERGPAHAGDPGGRHHAVGRGAPLPGEHRRVPRRVHRRPRRRQPRAVPRLRGGDGVGCGALRAVPGRPAGGRGAGPRAARARAHPGRPPPLHLPRQPEPARPRRDRAAGRGAGDGGGGRDRSSAPATTWRAGACTRSGWTSPAPRASPRCASGSRPRSPTCHGVVRATLHGALAPAVDLADLTDATRAPARNSPRTSTGWCCARAPRRRRRPRGAGGGTDRARAVRPGRPRRPGTGRGHPPPGPADGPARARRAAPEPAVVQP